eukprot:GHVU01132239.1.p1 GENE.GHVU01132239.1~~GHVU01132239.1.p1  ORF type:complete len:139 (-),score=18.70 GHVU01132239.1:62-478(-)
MGNESSSVPVNSSRATGTSTPSFPMVKKGAFAGSTNNSPVRKNDGWSPQEPGSPVRSCERRLRMIEEETDSPYSPAESKRIRACQCSPLFDYSPRKGHQIGDTGAGGVLLFGGEDASGLRSDLFKFEESECADGPLSD